MFLKEGRLAKILPPNQQIESLFAGANTLVLISLGSILLSSLTKRSGNPSRRVFPPLKTISLYRVILRSISTFARLFWRSWMTAIWVNFYMGFRVRFCRVRTWFLQLIFHCYWTRLLGHLEACIYLSFILLFPKDSNW